MNSFTVTRRVGWPARLDDMPNIKTVYTFRHISGD